MTALTRAAVVRTLAVLAIVLIAGGNASAQSYPTKQVRMIVPFGAGGPADVFARVLAQHLSEALKQNFIVENRPGAGAIIGTVEVAKAAPDGYTLLVMSNTHTVNESLSPKRNYELMRDFVPVSPINESDVMMVVNPGLGVKNLKDFIALAKSKPGQLNYASSGPGTPYHMAAELFKHMTGTNIVHVPHKTSGDMRTSVLGGHVQMMFDAITVLAPNAREGKVVALGTSGKKRSTVMPEVPTIDEAGVPGYEFDDLARRDGAGEDATTDRRPAQCGNPQDHGAAGDPGCLGPAGRGADDHDAAGVREVSERRHRQVGEGRERCRAGGQVRLEPAAAASASRRLGRSCEASRP